MGSDAHIGAMPGISTETALWGDCRRTVEPRIVDWVVDTVWQLYADTEIYIQLELNAWTVLAMESKLG
jgi:hypothetical protein